MGLSPFSYTVIDSILIRALTFKQIILWSYQVVRNNLTISTEKSLNKENKGKMLRQERYVGTMQRSFYVGESITEDDIKAKFENGVLSLMIPKKEAPKVPEKKQILIEG